MYSWKQIVDANATIKTSNIQGKQYAEVNQRIKAFRSICPMGAIVTEMLSCENGICIFRATVYDDEQKIIGTGTAYEKEGSTFINKTSYIENCETSAVGRALGMCGFGIDVSVASAEEVQNAMLNQGGEQERRRSGAYKPKNPTPRQALIARLDELGINVKDYAEKHGLGADTPPDVFLQCLEELRGR